MKTKNIAAAVLFFLAAIQGSVQGANYVLDLRTSADFVSVADHSSLDLTESFTIEAWVNSGLPFNQGGTVLAKRRSPNGDGYSLGVARNIAYFGMNDNTDIGNSDPIHNFSIGTPELVPAGEWHHLAGTFDGRTARIYVDGKLASSGTAPGKLFNSSQPLLIGQSGFPGDPRNFIGQIDEVRLWDTALTEQQIQANMWRVLGGREPNLVGYWNFNTGSPRDLGPFGNLGELVGGATIIAGFDAFPSERPVLSANGYSLLLGFRFQLHGEAGATYQIDSSTDMLQWTPFVQLTQPNETIVFTDTTATNFMNFRFYRVTRVP